MTSSASAARARLHRPGINQRGPGVSRSLVYPFRIPAGLSPALSTACRRSCVYPRPVVPSVNIHARSQDSDIGICIVCRVVTSDGYSGYSPAGIGAVPTATVVYGRRQRRLGTMPVPMKCASYANDSRTRAGPSHLTICVSSSPLCADAGLVRRARCRPAGDPDTSDTRRSGRASCPLSQRARQR
jgi:hypothetical protein